MEHCDGEIRAEGPKLSDSGDGVDRLSELPDDILIHILVKVLDAAVAARTSVLSSRWRRLWRLLPQLCFGPATDPLAIRVALESHEAPALHLLKVSVLEGTPDSVAPWLPIAARCLTGRLCIINKVVRNRPDDVVGERSAFHLPRFEKATSILLELGPLGLSMPPSCLFAKLTDLRLVCVHLHGPCRLDEVVSSPQCPSLQRLSVDDVWGIDNFIIHSDSLLDIELKFLQADDAPGLRTFTILCESLKRLELMEVHGLEQLTVMAPGLTHFKLRSCFSSTFKQPVANISAPQLVTLQWMDDYDPRFTRLGKMDNLRFLVTQPFSVYGRDHVHKLHNSYCMKLLRRFEFIHNLFFTLSYPLEITNHEYLMEDITRLPNIAVMLLGIEPNGHSLGASLFHFLRMCTGLKAMTLTLGYTTSHPVAQTVCPSGCLCDQPPNWKTEELNLNCLQDLEVWNLRGTSHEAALVKRLFDWATVLETMTVTFHCSVAESKAEEFFQMLQSFSRPEICLTRDYIE